MKRRPWGQWLLSAIFLYVLVSDVAFAFRHPGMTDTERFIRIWDALRWK